MLLVVCGINSLTEQKVQQLLCIKGSSLSTNGARTPDPLYIVSLSVYVKEPAAHYVGLKNRKSKFFSASPATKNSMTGSLSELSGLHFTNSLHCPYQWTLMGNKSADSQPLLLPPKKNLNLPTWPVGVLLGCQWEDFPFNLVSLSLQKSCAAEAKEKKSKVCIGYWCYNNAETLWNVPEFRFSLKNCLFQTHYYYYYYYYY